MYKHAARFWHGHMIRRAACAPVPGLSIPPPAFVARAHAARQPIRAYIEAKNRGGWVLVLLDPHGRPVKGCRCFCPHSAKGARRGAPEPGDGETFWFLVTKVTEGEVILSRRAFLAHERERDLGRLRAAVRTGHAVPGTVTRIEPYGAFVKMGSVTGLIHVSALSENFVAAPSEVVRVGEHVQVRVLGVDGKRVSLRLHR